MQFQKLKHVVTRYFNTKSLEKSKQIRRQPGTFIQMQICFLTKRKKKIGKYTAKLTCQSTTEVQHPHFLQQMTLLMILASLFGKTVLD